MSKKSEEELKELLEKIHEQVKICKKIFWSIGLLVFGLFMSWCLVDSSVFSYDITKISNFSIIMFVIMTLGLLWCWGMYKIDES